MRIINYTFAFILMLCPALTIAADNNGKLSEIIAKIKNVKQLLHLHQSAQVGLQKELQKTELAINEVSVKLTESNDQLRSKENKLQVLSAQQAKLKKTIAIQQQNLLHQIKMAYTLGMHKNEFDIILQTENPDKIARLLTYNRYLTAQTHSAVQHLQSNLVLLQQNADVLETHADQLKKMQHEQLLRQQALDSHKQKQQIVLQNIQQQVKNHTEELATLIKNKENLEKIIEKLHKHEHYSSDYLSHHKGKFPWPTEGKIVERFGSSISHSELKQNGIIIAAKEGQKVYAVAPGKVIFSNWMPGYGLLLIIDHGKGYMTLYGNNAALYKKTSEVVSGHDLIAKVGHSGGVQKSGLYFALRCQGKALDPSVWCGTK